MTRWLVVLLGLCAGLARAGVPDPMLDHLTGKWVLRGTIAGKQTVHDVEAHWVLSNAYLELHETSREKQPGGQPAYEAVVLIAWDAGRQRYACVWLDSTGITDGTLGVAPKSEGDELSFSFPGKDGVFHTVFAWEQKSSTWTWRMDGEEKGQLVPFARVELKRR